MNNGGCACCASRRLLTNILCRHGQMLPDVTHSDCRVTFCYRHGRDGQSDLGRTGRKFHFPFVLQTRDTIFPPGVFRALFRRQSRRKTLHRRCTHPPAMSALRFVSAVSRRAPISFATGRRGYAEAADKIKLSLVLPHQVRLRQRTTSVHCLTYDFDRPSSRLRMSCK